MCNPSLFFYVMSWVRYFLHKINLKNICTVVLILFQVIYISINCLCIYFGRTNLVILICTIYFLHFFHLIFLIVCSILNFSIGIIETTWLMLRIYSLLYKLKQWFQLIIQFNFYSPFVWKFLPVIIVEPSIFKILKGATML